MKSQVLPIPEPSGPLTLHHATRWHERLAGLLVGPRLPVGHGYWFTRCRAIHTIGMRYPIAVFFMDKEDRVTSAIGVVKPYRWACDLTAESVIETLPVRAADLNLAIARVEASARLARARQNGQ